MYISKLHSFPSTTTTTTPFLHLHHHSIQFNNPKNPNYLTFTLNFPSISLNCTSSTPNSLSSIKPYLQSEWKFILQGWAFSAISVFSLSKIVPKAGSLSSILCDVNSIKYDGAFIAGLFGVRLVSSYLQQACLWEAAFNCSYKIRVHVFQRVLERDLGFFDGGDNGGVSAPDIAHRITSEASDVAVTVFALLNTIVPSTLQLSAMAAQMLAISPTLTRISALVIPSVALAITLLGSRLQRISRMAHLSIAALSAYLNEVTMSVDDSVTLAR
ncbi:hypothetical protein KSS87_008711 [Heliosperma pusillum]|nr:hypothetical protein KSS87_008711 [Heliosperma pusillum]